MRASRFSVLVNEFDSSQLVPLVAVIVSVCLKFFWSSPILLGYLLASIPVFAAVESRFLLSLSRMPLSRPDFLDWGDIRVHLIAPVPFLAIGFAVWLFHDAPSTFVSRYVACLVLTVLCFLLGALVKSYAIYFGCVNLNQAKRGFFSIVERALLLTRTLMVTRAWFIYFRDLPSKWPLRVYILLKAVFLAHLGFGLVLTWRRYTARKAKGIRCVTMDEVKDDCAICLSRPINPCKLPCGHIFCRECMERWLATSPTCPTCRNDSLPVNVGMAEGTTAWVFFALPF
jgi:hypothetical protein